MTLRPLGRVMTVLESIGLEVTYAYDDLLFVQHGALLLQFAEDPETLDLYVNETCDPEEATRETTRVAAAFEGTGLAVTPKGTCRLTPNDDATLSIQFAPA